MPPELNPKLLYEFEFKETSLAISFFMPYDLEITLPNDVVVEMGRFSLGMLHRVQIIPQYEGGARLKIGAFCEAAKQSTILLGGDHANGSLLNYAFGAYVEHYQKFMEPEARALGIAPAKPITIGDNVILSRGAMILGSANVGTGCVIGAGAVVTGTCDPLGIYAGVPAKLLRKRFDGQMAELYAQMDLPNICAHCLPNLPPKVARLQSGEIDIEEFRASVEYLKARPKLHVSGILKEANIGINGINGFSIGGTPIVDLDTVAKLRNYFAQPATNPTSIQWSPDIFYGLGLQ